MPETELKQKILAGRETLIQSHFYAQGDTNMNCQLNSGGLRGPRFKSVHSDQQERTADAVLFSNPVGLVYRKGIWKNRYDPTTTKKRK